MKLPRLACAFLVASLAAPLAAGQGTFEKRTLSTEFFCEGATFGDLNRDGKNDVVSGPFWYEGPSFEKKHPLYPAKPFDPHGYSENFFPWVRDFDGDGFADILVVGFPGKEAFWLRNPGSDSDTKPWEIFVVFRGVDNESPHFEDITGDGKPELVFMHGGKVGFAGPGADPKLPWAFHAVSPDLKFPTFTHGLGVGDIDGDGRADILERTGWWQQPASLTGDPQWTRHEFLFSKGHGGAQMLVDDFDGDGDADVVSSLNAHAYGLSWFEQVREQGKITFREHTILNNSAEPNADGVSFSELHALTLCDIDGDGVRDVVTGKRYWSHGPEGDPDKGAPAVLYAFLVRKAPGKAPRFEPLQIDNDSGVGVFVVAGDIDGDRRSDVVIGNKKGTFVLLQQKPAARLSDAELIDRLIDAVRTSGLTFERNGSQHSAADAAKHLQRKRDAGAAAFKTPDEFIERVASRSSTTGEAYFIVGADGKKSEIGPWLQACLAELRATAPRPKGAASRKSERSVDAQTSAGDERLGFLPTADDGRALNLDFEAGDLSDWTASGDAFGEQPVRGDAPTKRGRGQPSRHQGEYWIGGYEKKADGPVGTLTSAEFKITHSWASFLVGGGGEDATRVELCLAGAKKPFFVSPGAYHESLQRVVVDLRAHAGKRMFVRVVDSARGHWGHVNFDNFRFHGQEPKPERAPDVPPILPVDQVTHAGLSPQDAAKAMDVPDGFRVEVVAAEPDLHQPVALAIDAKGRLWVAEALSYPNRQPEGKGKDDIVVFEDADHDGTFEKRTIFAKDLNLVSGLEVGFGGVWVGAAPYLLFIPDANEDLVPDGEAQVLLDGWGYQDTHETLNAFIWGPDGWLYGCHGVFTHSKVGKPGTPDAERVPLNAAVWRFHPQRHEFETFARGTSNPWGVDFNDYGEAFISACVIPHLYHIVPGGRYERQAGNDFNPYTYGEITTIADHRHYLGDVPHAANLRSNRAGGGHAHCGAMIYLGDQFPSEYRNRIFMSNIHGNRYNVDVLEPVRSGYVGKHGDDFLISNDRWFRGICMKTGPDGSVYVIDWYDKQACHDTRSQQWDRSNGRLYRVSYGAPKAEAVDLAKLTNQKLAQLQGAANDWYVRHARRILQERKAGPDVIGTLREMLEGSPDETRRLRALWAIHATGALSESIVSVQLQRGSPYVQAWTVTLAAERGKLPREVHSQFVKLARETSSAVVRRSLASALQRLRIGERWEIAAALAAHGEDAADPNIPFLLWYAVEPLVPAEPQRAFALAAAAKIPQVGRWIVRRAAEDPALRGALVVAMSQIADPTALHWMLEEMRSALSAQRNLKAPDGWAALAERLAASPDATVREHAVALSIAFGDRSSVPALRATAADRAVDLAQRTAALDALVRAKDPNLGQLLRSLFDDAAMRPAAIRALAFADDAQAPAALLALYPNLTDEERRDALNVLSSRAAYARPLLEAVGSAAVPRAHISAFVLRQLRNLKDAAVDDLVKSHFGNVRETAADKLARIRQWRSELTEGALAAADVSAGRELFSRTCQQCHTLFGAGGNLGPDLTGSNRRDLDYLLTNAVDPSAVVSKEYVATNVWLKSTQFVAGRLRAQNDTAVTIQTESQTLVIPRSDIDEIRESEISTMPEGLLDAFTAEQRAQIVAYLRGDHQVPMRATPSNVARFFNGKDLAGWLGDPKVWRVEAGEIVGAAPQGLARNEFLKSELDLGDFRLAVEVRLAGDEGNSGIQFRTRALEDGEVAGYQADIGPGWWGKLYEEGGRAVLSEKSGEPFVRRGDWNEYVIEAVGHRVRTWINGMACVDLDDPKGALRGIVAFQVHSGGPTEIRFRNLRLELLEGGAK